MKTHPTESVWAEGILFPIIKYSAIIKRENPLEGGTTENELRDSIPGALEEFVNNAG